MSLLLWLGAYLELLVFITYTNARHLETKDVVVVIMSQADAYNSNQAELLKKDLLDQSQNLNQPPPVIQLFHEDFLHPGAWTILPVITRLNTIHGRNSSWILFLEPRTRVDLSHLLEELSAISKKKEEDWKHRKKENKKEAGKGIWVGHAMIDREPTIIHHFQNEESLSYPHFSAGFAMDRNLLNEHMTFPTFIGIFFHFGSLSDRLEAQWDSSRETTSDFSIDASHEVALFVWNSGQGIRLTHSDVFCLLPEKNDTKNHNCATWFLPFEPCGDMESSESVYFAVKTCSKFHHDRLPVVKRTWAKYAVHIDYFSDIEDLTIPSINLGVPNTEYGHCSKTKAILQYVSQKMKEKSFENVKWIVLVDDDTILSVARLLSLLSCFRIEGNSKPMVLGERYGYRVSEPPDSEFPSPTHIYGYNYATGGGGVALNREAVKLVSNPKLCICPSHDAPDDMVLFGSCLSRLGIMLTHSPSFHQARPSDYSPKYLTTQHLVSFHKHWMIDPLHVYNVWFASSDQKIKFDKPTTHLEL